MKNIFADLRFSEQNEIVSEIFNGENFRIERILSYGQSGDWQVQNEDEWVCVIDGEGHIEYENGSQIKLCLGDTLFIPAFQKHRVSYTSKGCFWLCVFSKSAK